MVNLNRILVSFGLIAALGCSGGGGSTSSSPVTATAASEGQITGFGSVILNGARWNTDDASFEVEGRAARQSDLRIGMVVRVEGSRRQDGSTRADRVIFESRLRGPIREIEDVGPDMKRLRILGVEAVVTRAGTTFRDTTFDDLTTDRVADVSGLLNQDGGLDATHLRDRGVPRVGVTEVKLFGEVAGLSGGSFLIGPTEILFDEDDLEDDFGPGGLDEGDAVRVEGILLANDAVDADEIETPRRDRDDDDDFDEFEVEGIVSNFVSLAEFDVSGQAVDASTARLMPNEPELVMDGVRVEVEGEVDANGVLVARKLKIRSNKVRIHAEVADDRDVDPAADSLVLLGIEITVDPDARMRDQRDGQSGFSLEDVVAGDFLEVRGIAHPDGSVVATRLERDRPDGIRLKGPVDEIDDAGRTFSILGVVVPTDGGTQFEIEDDDVERRVSEQDFYQALSLGRIVQVQDREDGDETAIDVADEAELEELDLEEDDDEDDDDDDDDEDDDDDDDEDEDDDRDEDEDEVDSSDD